MFGKATLEIPGSGNIGPSTTGGLSDELAMILGRTAAMTLADEDGDVLVTLSDGTVKVIGHEAWSGNIVVF